MVSDDGTTSNLYPCQLTNPNTVLHCDWLGSYLCSVVEASGQEPSSMMWGPGMPLRYSHEHNIPKMINPITVLQG
jgi:hypothetical protein